MKPAKTPAVFSTFAKGAKGAKGATHSLPAAGLALATALLLFSCETKTSEQDPAARQLKSVTAVNASLREELRQLESEEPPTIEGLDARLQSLRDEVNALRDENSALRLEIDSYKKRFPLR